MADFETKLVLLPVPVAAPGAKPSLVRNQTTAAFVSQLLAERANLAPQRTRRRGSAEGAIGAYSAGAKVTNKRMPMGFRTTIFA